MSPLLLIYMCWKSNMILWGNPFLTLALHSLSVCLYLCGVVRPDVGLMWMCRVDGHRCDSAPPSGLRPHETLGYKADLLNTFFFYLPTTTAMPCNYRGEAKTKFPLPKYPQEDQYNNPARYEAAVECFMEDCACVFAKHDQWVDHEVVADIAHASKAMHQKVEEDKK